MGGLEGVLGIQRAFAPGRLAIVVLIGEDLGSPLTSLSPLFPPGSVEREKWDVASGRADVIFTPQLGSRFVAEIKWRTSQWKTQDVIERDYLAQAANYTATGPPFAVLLVGDVSDHSAGYRDIEDSIWVISHARSATEIPRLVVTGVLPTARQTPHALRVQRSASTRGRQRRSGQA